MRTDEYRNMFIHQHDFWWYRGMAEINIRLLKKFLAKKTGNLILDAGCGTGSAFWYLSKFGSVVGVDASDEALGFASKFGRVKKGVVTDLPFEGNKFDLVVCLDVLYHKWVADWRGVIGELHRVIKPGGLLLLREPAYKWLAGSHDKVDFAGRRFTKDQIERVLIKNKFAIKKSTYVNFFLFPFVFLKRFFQKRFFIRDKRSKSDISTINQFLNYLFYHILKIEASLIENLSFPFGSSLVMVAQKLNTAV